MTADQNEVKRKGSHRYTHFETYTLFLARHSRARRAGSAQPGQICKELIRTHESDPSRSSFPHPKPLGRI